MFQEKYNYRYLLQQSFNNFNDSNPLGTLIYHHLMDACIGRDELSLFNKLLKETYAYSKKDLFTNMINLSIKIETYLNRTPIRLFNQDKNILTTNMNVIKLFYRISKMFYTHNCYYTALKWINKIYEYINNNKAEINKEQEEDVSKMKEDITNEYNKYKLKLNNKSELKYAKNTQNLYKKKYYITKKWYQEYQSYIDNNNDKEECFPREIDNHILLCGKDMLDSEQYLLDDNKKEDLLEIDEDEWYFLKNKFNYTVELKVDIMDKKYKVLVIDYNDRKNQQFSFFKPKYLLLNSNNSLYNYFNNKYSQNNIHIYQYKSNLSKKQIKETLFDIMFFYSQTTEETIKLHQDLIEAIQETQTLVSNQIIIVDTANFIKIINKNQCFNCEKILNTNINSKYCSNPCKNTFEIKYNNIICKYKNFYNHNKELLKNHIIDSNNSGLKGLHNLGNTCYMNASFQCLFHCEAFINYFTQQIYNQEPLNTQNDKSITNALVSLNKQFWNISNENGSNMSSLSPRELRNAFIHKEKLYDNKNQHDAPEFISNFLDQLSKEVNRSQSSYYDKNKNSLTTAVPLIEFGKTLDKINSIVEDLFYGQVINKFECNNPNCKHMNNIFESFLLLDLPIPKNKDLSSLYSKKIQYQFLMKFKYFQFEKVIPEIKEFLFQFEDINMTVKDFKNKFSNENFKFDIFNISYNDHFDELKEETQLFEEDLKGKIKIKDTFYEIVLYETSDKEIFNHPLLFPFTGIIKDGTEKENDFWSFLNVCLNSQRSELNPNEVKISEMNKLNYPIRIQIKKNEDVKPLLWKELRDTIFRQKKRTPPPILDTLEYDGLIYEKKQFPLINPKKSNTKINLNIYKKINCEQSNITNEEVRYFFLAPNKSDLPSEVFSKDVFHEGKEIYTEESKKELDLKNLFDLHHKPLINKVKCRKCSHSTTLMSFISKLPVYLCIHLKRFEYNDKEQRFKKITKYVDFPELLNIYSYIEKEKDLSFENETKYNECDYELFGVIEHRGTLSSGHYVAYVKVRGTWYLFNDSNVSENNGFKNGNDLVLFYKRKIAFK